MNAKSCVKRWIRALGYELVRYSPRQSPHARRRQLLRAFDIDLVLDVGASVGHFARALREMGYRGRIVSYEPLGASYARLADAARGDPLWETRRCALGERPGSATIHVAGNSDSSSLLPMLERHREAAPGTGYVADETIDVRTLDEEFAGVSRGARHVYLKLDVQGYEGAVLDGARRALPSIDTIQLELSLVPLYEGGPLMDEMWARLRGMGYQMVSIEPGFADDRTGLLLQVDGIFHRIRDGAAREEPPPGQPAP